MRVLASRKKIMVFTSILLVVVLATALIWWRHAQITKTSSVSPTCSAYGGTFDSLGPTTNDEMVNDYSKFIVTTTIENPEIYSTMDSLKDAHPRFKITQVLKGNDLLHKGDVISICSNLGFIDLPQKGHPTMLLFLEGKDGDSWVPSLGYFGINTEDEDGRFTISGFKGQKPVTVDELKELIK